MAARGAAGFSARKPGNRRSHPDPTFRWPSPLLALHQEIGPKPTIFYAARKKRKRLPLPPLFLNRALLQKKAVPQKREAEMKDSLCNRKGIL
jgi:hypothetical protein